MRRTILLALVLLAIATPAFAQSSTDPADEIQITLDGGVEQRKILSTATLREERLPERPRSPASNTSRSAWCWARH